MAATRSIASRARSRLLTLTFDISQLPAPKNWAMAGGSNGYRAALVRRQLTLGLISSLPGTAGSPPFIFFSTSYPELDSAARRPMRRIGNDGTAISRSPKQSCSWFGGCEIASGRKHATLRSIDARSEIRLSHAGGSGMRSTQRKLYKPSAKTDLFVVEALRHRALGALPSPPNPGLPGFGTSKTRSSPPSWVTWGGASACKSESTELAAQRRCRGSAQDDGRAAS